MVLSVLFGLDLGRCPKLSLIQDGRATRIPPPLRSGMALPSPVQEASLQVLIQRCMASSLKGFEDGITRRVHHPMREIAKMEDVSEGNVSAPGGATSDQQAARTKEHVEKSRSSSSGSGRGNQGWCPARKSPQVKPQLFQGDSGSSISWRENSRCMLK